MNELSINNQVSYQVGEIQFVNYDEILKQAYEVAELIKSVEVDEDSIQGTKKLLASVNKKVNELEQERIRIKKELLVPYMEFEKQIKTITSVVKESDFDLRSKVKELEEIEREKKREMIVNLFNVRISKYPELVNFSSNQFIVNKHLNKTTSMNQIELEMVQWLEQRKKDVELINALNGDIGIYEGTLSIHDALPKPEPTVTTNEQTVDTPKKTMATIQFDVKDLPQVHLLFKMSGIEYNQI